MSDIESVVRDITRRAVNYQASEEIKATLRQKVMVPLIGVFAVGKTTIMQAAVAIDREFGRVRSFTTRPRRAGETDEIYDFIPPTALPDILREVTNRRLVQVAVHPTTGQVYGSRAQDYSAPYCMLDTVPGALPGLTSLPFRSIRRMVVVAPPSEWRGRFQERAVSSTPDDIRKRLDEGVTNIEWSLKQGNGVLWLNSDGRSIVQIATEFVNVVRGRQDANPGARRVASKLLETMRELKAAA